jgi:trans-2,3-dihydro-3-hydroxyanthranilate isomerase
MRGTGRADRPGGPTVLRYHLLDVFTDTPFEGNPLAVFVDPPPLSSEQMQRIAAELNLSETVFTWPPADADGGWRTRIFTPGSELPFAGHPTIGTACLLSLLGHVATGRVVLDEGVGPVDVRIVPDREEDEPDAWLTVPRAAERLPCPAAEAVAGALGLSSVDLHGELPVEAWSAGVPFLVVPVRDLDALGRSAVDASAWPRDVASAEASQLFVVTPVGDVGRDGGRWRARMFAPGLGITEDPATGAAVAAFSGYLLARHDGEAEGRWRIEQGVEMGRPSVLLLDIGAGGGAPPVVRIGGRSALIGEGRFLAPP